MIPIMKKRLFPLILICLTILFCFSTGLFASDTEKFYADEDSGENIVTDFIFSNDPSDTVPFAKNGNLIVVLDPGHGGFDSGAENYNGSAYEKNLNLKVAQYCKAYLEKYSNVTVYMTRTNDTNPGANKNESLGKRASIAASYGADIFISIHFNSADSSTAKGAEVYVSSLEEYSLTELGNAIMTNLKGLGISDRGVRIRTSESKPITLWTDGIRPADYYGVIKASATRNIPGMIIEHCFINNPAEYNSFASSDAKLKALGEADAKAIVSHFRLNESISATTLENRRYTALNTLKNSVDPMNYNAKNHPTVEKIYNDAVERIEAATGTGKIDLTLNRATKTIAHIPKAGANETIFSDVKKNDWFCNAVLYCYQNGLFYGTSDTTYSPRTNISRGMFITVIGRIEKIGNTVPANTKFSDVDPKMYYAPYVKWASEKGIVAGISETKFAPDDPIRREDLVRMIHNYCLYKGIELPSASTKTVDDFTDSDTIDEYAKENMVWAVSTGLLKGNDKNILNPRGNASRAEVSQIMKVFYELITK